MVTKAAWLAFTLDTDDATARRRFQEKHGYLPAQLLRDRGLLLAGPIADDHEEVSL